VQNFAGIELLPHSWPEVQSGIANMVAEQWAASTADLQALGQQLSGAMRMSFVFRSMDNSLVFRILVIECN
jgi:hypothetical protein